MKFVSTQRAFSLCSVHNSDKIGVFLWVETSSSSMLDSGVSDRGVSISASVVSSLPDREDGVDESVGRPEADSSGH